MPSRQVTIHGVMTWDDLGFWGGSPPPYPDQGLPGQPPYPSQGPGFPTHPIAPGGPPLGTWGGVAPPWVSHPIAPGGSPGYPSHPIYYPPYPSQGPGFPTHPIVVPPPPSTEPPVEGVKPPPEGGGWGYVENWGWGYFPKPTEAGPKG